MGGGKDGVAMDRRTAGAIRTNSASADSNNSFETRRLAVDGVGITCYAAGSGRDTIVLLHGAGVDSALMSWAEVMPLLADTYRVVAPDLPGYGASDRISGEYSLAFYTDMVKGVIEAVADGPVILAGLSLGGGISFNLALGHPELIKVLVPVGAWGVFDKLPWHRLTYWYTRSKLNENLYAWTGKYRWFVKWSLTSSLFGDASKVSDELVDQVQQAMLQPGAGWPFISFQRSEITPSGLRTDLFGRLERIAHPTLLVHGSHDRAVPVQGAIAASKKIPDCELYIMEGCKHWPQKERPDEFARVVRDFLARRL